MFGQAALWPSLPNWAMKKRENCQSLPRYKYVPVLLDTGIFLMYQYYPKMFTGCKTCQYHLQDPDTGTLKGLSIA